MTRATNLTAILSLTLALFASAQESRGQSRPNDDALRSSPRRIHVDCDRGHKLQRAVERARAGTTIFVHGTCAEQIIVTTDGLQIRGVRGAAIDGDIGKILYEGTLTVAGARGVVISDMEVRNGPDQGIVIQKDASAELHNLSVHGNATIGVAVDASYAELANVVADDNGGGFDFFSGARIIALGQISAKGNRGSGLAVNGNSSLELRGSIVETSENGGDGVTLVNDSSLLILSFPESQGSGIEARNNRGAAGIFVADSTISVVGSQFFGSGANVFEISGHNVGMLLIASNLASPFATAKFEVSGNGVGILMTDNSDATVVGGLNVRNNQVGLIGDGAGVLRLGSTASNPSTVRGNAGVDVQMGFGSRIDIQAGVEIGSLVCDRTVLTPKGPCPEAKRPLESPNGNGEGDR